MLALPLDAFFFIDAAANEIYTLSLHDALPICRIAAHLPQRLDTLGQQEGARTHPGSGQRRLCAGMAATDDDQDRKSTRLNSSHSSISYAVFCLKKKKKLSRTPNSPD